MIKINFGRITQLFVLMIFSIFFNPIISLRLMLYFLPIKFMLYQTCLKLKFRDSPKMLILL